MKNEKNTPAMFTHWLDELGAALKRMGEKGREFVSQHYTWEAICPQMEAAYRQAIAG